MTARQVEGFPNTTHSYDGEIDESAAPPPPTIDAGRPEPFAQPEPTQDSAAPQPSAPAEPITSQLNDKNYGEDARPFDPSTEDVREEPAYEDKRHRPVQLKDDG